MSFRSWVKRGEHPVARLIWRTAKGSRKAQLPCFPAIHKPLYRGTLAAKHVWHELRRALWWTPLFQSRLVRPAKGLYLFNGIPQILGSLDLEFGEDCTLSGQTTFTGRTAGAQTPRLIVGDRSEIGWQVTIAVGRRVEIGRDVKIAGKCFLAGYPGHPQDPVRRAAQRPDDEDQVGDIVLEDDVWLATDVTVVAGVRIGAGSIVTAGSVVFRDIPPGVIASGNPARIAGPVRFDEPAVAMP
jgi:acetyltransferase-like isoleucine patch superfamily enzyme